MAIGRVIKEYKTSYDIFDAGKEYKAVVRGKFHLSEMGYPKVGDYVEYEETSEDEAVIEAIQERTTQIARKAVGDSTEQQVIVANVDVIFVVMGLDNDFNLNRLERYLVLADQSNIKPVIILNKADKVENPEGQHEQVKSRFSNVDSYVVSAKQGINMEVFAQYLPEERTGVLLGSSGAGKSTITNWLLQNHTQETQIVRDTGVGRHTTTSRQLFFLPSGGCLIDTPGLRELGLMGEVTGSTFEIIERLSLKCRFNDCDHYKSAGCAVRMAIEEGEVTEEQLENYLKLKREKEYLDSRGDPVAQWRHKQKNRALHKKYKQIQKDKYGRL